MNLPQINLKIPQYLLTILCYSVAGILDSLPIIRDWRITGEIAHFLLNFPANSLGE